MRRIVNVGIGEYAIANGAADEIKTYGLGSCIALIVYDWRRKMGALIHIAYPEASVNPTRARDQPAYFADTGIPLLMNDFVSRNKPDRRDLTLKIAGGATIMDEEGRFNIGKRNALAVKRQLWRLGYGLKSEDIGGNISRTISLSVGTGTTLISNGAKRWEL